MPPVLVSNKYIDSSLGARLRAAERRGLAATSIDLLLAEEAGLADEWAVDVENGCREERLAQRQEEMVPERESLAIEAYIGLAQMRPALGHEISRLGPFGRGNPEPLLASRRVRLVNVTSTGLSRRHTRLLVEDEGGIAFLGCGGTNNLRRCRTLGEISRSICGWIIIAAAKMCSWRLLLSGFWWRKKIPN